MPTSGRSSPISETLESLIQHIDSSEAIEILVVDNGISSEIRTIVADASKKLSTPIRYLQEHRPGLHHARHAGAAAANGAVLIYIDDDVSISENWLSTYLAAYEDPNVAAAGGRVVPIWESAPPDWIDVVPRDYFSLLDYGSESRPLAGSESINGCNYSIRRESLFNAGGFHPDGYSDPSLIWLRGDGEAGLIRELRSRHEKVMYLAEAEVGHRISDDRLSIASLSRRAFAHGIENGYTFARKRHCRAWSLAALYLIGLSATLTLIPMYGARSDTAEYVVRRMLAAARYRAIRSYAARLARNSDLREHVMRSTYIEQPPSGPSRSRAQ